MYIYLHMHLYILTHIRRYLLSTIDDNIARIRNYTCIQTYVYMYRQDDKLGHEHEDFVNMRERIYFPEYIKVMVVKQTG